MSMKTLNARQIEAFRATVLTGSMTAAGAFLHVTQPAISRLIRDLERQIDMKLFTRRGKQLHPTDEALLLHREVQRNFQGLEEIARAAAEIRGLQTGSLRVAAMPALALGYLPRIVRRFVDKRPRLAVQLHTDTSRNILGLVAAGQYDIGIGAVPMEHPGVQTDRLPRLEAVCVLPANHPLARRKTIHLRDLKDTAMISLGRNSLLQFHIEFMLRNSGVTPQRRIEATIGATICGLVGEGLGVAIIDPFTAAAIHDGRIVSRSFRPAIPYECAVVTPSYRTKARIVDEFLLTLHKTVSEDFRSLGLRRVMVE